ncbi:hypothetical protein GCM10010302_61630 [Streptomyces polychromogenes]|uniref:Secreted protein n=1 Tax=Streptomyces polychromogenes TaxID=67342 RepID=A0ABN0VQG5_9ACTN
MNRTRLLAAAVPPLLAAALCAAAAGAPTASAADPAAKPPVPHCVASDGFDFNAVFHVRERIIAPPPTCRVTLAKERWVRATFGWSTAVDAASAVYPPGYKPLRPGIAPIEDFNAKFVSATYVHDIGTPQERTFTFKKKEVLRTGLFTSDGFPYSAPVSPPFKALSVGTHTSTVFVTLSAEHCDGVAPDREADCLPAGTIRFSGDDTFEVQARPADVKHPARLPR